MILIDSWKKCHLKVYLLVDVQYSSGQRQIFILLTNPAVLAKIQWKVVWIHISFYNLVATYFTVVYMFKPNGCSVLSPNSEYNYLA